MLLSQPRQISARNPNIFTPDDEIISTQKNPLPKPLEPLKPTTKELKFKFKTIFDQPPIKKGLFMELEDGPKENPNIITAALTRDDYKASEYTDEQITIIEANDALKNDNFELAEQILQRPLTPNEIIRKRVSDERLYTQPMSEPSYKSFENLTITFLPEENQKLIDLQKILTQYGIPYRVQRKDDRYELVSFTKRLSTFYTRPIITSSREEEITSDKIAKDDIENKIFDTKDKEDVFEDLFRIYKYEINNNHEDAELRKNIIKEELPSIEVQPETPERKGFYNSKNLSEYINKLPEEKKTIFEKNLNELGDTISLIPVNWRSQLDREDKINPLASILGIDTTKSISQKRKQIRKILDFLPQGKKGRKKPVPPPYEEKSELKGEGLKKSMTYQNTRKNRLLEFGKYMIDPKSLDQNILRFYTKGKSRIHNLPFSYVSRNMVGILKDMLENKGTVNLRMFNMLKTDEKDLMERILRQSQVDFQMSKDEKDDDSSVGMGYMSSPQLIERLEVLMGSIDAGNDSKEVKNDISNILSALVYRRILTRSKAKMIQKKVFGKV